MLAKSKRHAHDEHRPQRQTLDRISRTCTGRVAGREARRSGIIRAAHPLLSARRRRAPRWATQQPYLGDPTNTVIVRSRVHRHGWCPVMRSPEGEGGGHRVPGSGGPADGHGGVGGVRGRWGPVWGSFGSGGVFLGPGCVHWRRRVRWCVRCRGVPVFGLRLVCSIWSQKCAK